MALIIFASFLSLLQSGIAQYIQQPYIIQLPELERIPSTASAPVHIPETIRQMKFPIPTTVITDCTPSVCHNLGNLVQLMIVSNLLQNTNVGSTAALKMALPIIREALSSPSLANICPESIKRKFDIISSRIPNTPNIVQTVPTPKIAVPNLEVIPNLFLSNDLLREVPSLNTVPNIIYQNLPLSENTYSNNKPMNTVFQNLPFDIFETRVPKNPVPSNIIYQNLPLPVNTFSNNIPLNTVLQNSPLDIFETIVSNLNSLPPNIVYKNLPLPLNSVSNNIPLNKVLQNIHAELPIQNVQAVPAKIVYKTSPYERIDATPNFVYQNTPIGNLNTISSSLPLTISSPNTKPVLKFLIRS